MISEGIKQAEIDLRSPQNTKIRGAYLTTEEGCLQSISGAYLHIKNGFKELQQHFDMTALLPAHIQPYFEDDHFIASIPKSGNTPRAATETKQIKNPFKGLLKDLKLFYLNHRYFFTIYKQLKKERPEFLYERVAYLNFTGIIASKLLGIKYISEVNGLYADEIKRYYLSPLNFLIKYFTIQSYKRSDLCFLVGGLKFLLKLEGNKYVPVQNGVEREFLQHYKGVKKIVKNPIHICMIAHLVKYHKIESLFEAIRHLEYPEMVHLHLIGKNFESVLAKIPPQINYTHHGPVKHQDLLAMSENFHIGVIPAAPEGWSNMKLYTYGALKMMALIPSQKNFTENFSPEEAFFFDQEKEGGLSVALQEIIGQEEKISIYAENLYQKVSSTFTWDKIFEECARQIHHCVESNNKRSKQ